MKQIYRIIIIFLATTFLALLIFFFSNSKLKTDRTWYDISTVHISNSYETYLNQSISLAAFKTNNWVFNENMMQYATVMSLEKKRKQLDIELIALSLNKIGPEEKAFIRCIIKLNKHLTVLKIATEVTQLKYYLKIKCALSKNEYKKIDNSLMVVSIVDIRDYQISKNLTINGQKPNYYDSKSSKKLKSAINCVVVLNQLTDPDDFSSWIKIILKTGIQKINLYYVRNLIHINLVSQLRYKYSDMVKVNRYEMNVTAICTRMLISDIQSCRKKYRHMFKRDKNSIKMHESIILNECMLNSKFAYRFLTNFNINEFVIPRFHKTFYHELVAEANIKKPNENCTKYFDEYKLVLKAQSYKCNIENYLEQLIKLYGQNIALFTFGKALFLPQFNSIFEDALSNFSSKTEYSFKQKLKAKISNDNTLATYLNSTLKAAKVVSRCLTQEYLAKNKSKTFHPNSRYLNSICHFNRINLKSVIFKTEHVDYIDIDIENQHLITEGQRTQEIIPRHGFISQFVDYHQYKFTTIEENLFVDSFQNWVVDLEYFYFLKSMQ